jgi:hypothetical protein
MSSIYSLFCVGEKSLKQKNDELLTQPACSAGTSAVILKDVNCRKEIWIQNQKIKQQKKLKS